MKADDGRPKFLQIHTPLPPPQRKQMRSKSSKSHEFLQSLCCSVLLHSHYISASAGSCVSAHQPARYTCWTCGVWSLWGCYCHLALSSLLQSLQQAQKWYFPAWLYLSVWLRDVTFPLLTLKWSAEPDVLWKIQAASCFLSGLQVSFFWETPMRDSLFPCCSVWLHYAKWSLCILCSTMR